MYYRSVLGVSGLFISAFSKRRKRMDPHIFISLGIFLAALIILGINKFNMGAVSMIAMILMVLTGCLDAKTALSKFGEQNVILMGAMFIVAKGFSKTQLVNKITDVVYSLGKGSFNRCLTLFLLFAFIMIPFAGSPMARIAIFYPLLQSTCERCGKSPSKGMFALGLVGLVCNTGLPIGSGAIAYLNFNTYLENFGSTGYAFTMWDPFKAKVVPALIMLAYCIFVAPKLSPDEPPVPIQGMDVKAKRTSQMGQVQEVAGYSIFIGVALGLFFAEQLGVPQWMVVVLGAVLMHLFGVMDKKEVRATLPLDMMLLLAGFLAVGDALVKTGAGDLIGNSIVTLIGDTRNEFVINTIFFMIPFIMTQFMNNAATATIVRPLVIMACVQLGCNPMAGTILVAQASMGAFLTPMATTSIPIMMAAGGYDQKSLLKQGWLPWLIFAAANIIWTTLMFPAWT